MANFFVVWQHILCRVILMTWSRFHTTSDLGGGLEVMAKISCHRASSSSSVQSALGPIAPTDANDDPPSSPPPYPNLGSSQILTSNPDSLTCKPAYRPNLASRSATGISCFVWEREESLSVPSCTCSTTVATVIIRRIATLVLPAGYKPAGGKVEDTSTPTSTPEG